MSNRVLARHLTKLPEGWTLQPIQAALQEVDNAIAMRDDDSYKLVSVRRRNGGLFYRAPLKGSEILTKTLRHIVPGSFIIARMQAVHRATAFVGQDFAGAAISKSYSSFIGTKHCRAEYFSWLATQPLMYDYILDSSHGVVIEKMTFDQARWMTLEVPLPPVEEQDRIIEILNDVTEQIRNTESVLHKLRQVHQGLLADLIKRPVNSPSHCASAQPILDNYVTWLSGGTPSKAREQHWNGNIAWLTPKDMKSRIVSRTTDFLTPSGVAHGSRLVPEDAVFIVVRGMILVHTFPVCRLGKPAAFNQDVKAVVPRKGLNSDYLSYWFTANSNHFLRLVSEATHGTKKLDLPDLKKVPVDFPDEAEQRRVVSVLTAHEHRIDVESELLAKLKAQRSGLASDLLMGRVRVLRGAAS